MSGLEWSKHSLEKMAERRFTKSDVENLHSNHIEEMKGMFSEDELDWISSYDAIKLYAIRKKIEEDGFESWLESVNENKGKWYEAGRSQKVGTSNVVILPNQRLAVIWQEEAVGQISDGIWENSSKLNTDDYGEAKDKWREYTNADVDVVQNKIELDGYAPSIDFTRLLNLPEQQARMVYQVRMSGADPSYTREDLKSDIKKLNNL